MLRRRKQLRPIRWLLLGLCWVVLGCYASFQSGLVNVFAPDDCCCGADAGRQPDDRCPPDCGDNSCCPGQALVVASPQIAMPVKSVSSDDLQLAPAQPIRPGFGGQVFRPPRVLA